MTKYKTSTDYERLYELVKDGLEAVVYIPSNKKMDIARIRRFKEKDIIISVSGTQYGGVSAYEEGSEKELFIKDCKCLNLEYIEPHEKD